MTAWDLLCVAALASLIEFAVPLLALTILPIVAALVIRAVWRAWRVRRGRRAVSAAMADAYAKQAVAELRRTSLSRAIQAHERIPAQRRASR